MNKHARQWANARKIANPQFARKRATRHNDRLDRLDTHAAIFGAGMEIGR